MNKALFFIAYHPGTLVQMNYIREMCKEHFQSVLIICDHPYFNKEIDDLYSNKFTRTIYLPLIRYEVNFFKCVRDIIRFSRALAEQIQPIINSIDSFNIISNLSAYLPVNVVLSRLKRNRKCSHLISISDDPAYTRDIDFFKTLYILSYSFLFRLYPVYCDRKIRFMYLNSPRDRILKFISPFTRDTVQEASQIRSCPTFSVSEPLVERASTAKDIVIIYGDTTVTNFFFGERKPEDYEELLQSFFNSLSRIYGNCRLLYKPHPQDNMKVMPGLEGIPIELYKGGLTSQMHLNSMIIRVRACYSVASTSLLYSADRGIPSYTFYHYLGFRGEFPKSFFESEEVLRNPFLYNISNIDEIGIIDTKNFEPMQSQSSDKWLDIMT